jgi:hypothetical protein
MEQIDQEIAEGKLGIARDRLQGLLGSFPSDLSIRTKLGEVYWKLGYPIDAGRFWFTELDPNEVQQQAVTKFLEHHRFDTKAIEKSLKLPAGLLEPLDLEIRQRCANLARDHFQKQVYTDSLQADEKSERTFRRMGWGCFFVIAIITVALIRLLIDILNWIF